MKDNKNGNGLYFVFDFAFVHSSCTGFMSMNDSNVQSQLTTKTTLLNSIKKKLQPFRMFWSRIHLSGTGNSWKNCMDLAIYLHQYSSLAHDTIEKIIFAADIFRWQYFYCHQHMNDMNYASYGYTNSEKIIEILLALGQHICKYDELNMFKLMVICWLKLFCRQFVFARVIFILFWWNRCHFS